MAEDNKNIQTKETKGANPELTPEEVTALQTEVTELKKKQSDLNQGIAKYRDDSKTNNQKVKELNDQIVKLQTKLKESDESGEDVSVEEKALAKLLKKKGYVTKAELEEFKKTQSKTSATSIRDQAVTEFLNDFPQYDDNEEFAKIAKEFQLYKTPTSLTGYKNLLKRIHKTLSGTSSEKKGANKLRAKMANKSRLSLGGGSQKDGGNAEQLENLEKKYPNLSREQIETRLEEIDAITPKKDDKK